MWHEIDSATGEVIGTYSPVTTQTVSPNGLARQETISPYFVRGDRVMFRFSFVWGDTADLGTVVYVHGAAPCIPTPSNDAYWSEHRMYAPHMRYVVRWDDGKYSTDSIADLMPEPTAQELAELSR